MAIVYGSSFSEELTNAVEEIKQAAGVKTYYVIKRPAQHHYAPRHVSWRWVRTVQETEHYESLAAVARAFPSVERANGGPAFPVFIVKVTETPGTGETRRELGETEAAKSGEVVKYAVFGEVVREWWKGGSNGYYKNWERSLAELKSLYISQYDAISDIARANPLGRVTVRRIAVKPNEPTITETVLA
jgi:hypothetical protein